MRKVVDANFLRDARLDSFLGANDQNAVVFNEFACMECYKGNSIENIRNSIEIVTRYPERVIVLKSTREVIELGPIPSGRSGLLIDAEQTSGFPYFCKQVARAVDNNHELLKEVLKLGDKANQQLEHIKDDVGKIVQGIQTMSQSFAAEDLKAIRKQEPLSPAAAERVLRHILCLAAVLVRDPSISQMSVTFPTDSLPRENILSSCRRLVGESPEGRELLNRR